MMTEEEVTETAIDEQGTLLWCQPYPFRRLFRAGQDLVANGQRYLVLACDKRGAMVVMTLRRVMGEG